MKQRSTWAVTLLVIMLLTVVISCAPATTPNSNPTSATPATSTRHQRTNGTLTKINGNILTLTTAQGQTTVITSDNTTVQNVTTGTLSDLHAGGYLFAIGPQDANGNISATSIMIRPQGAPPTPPNGAPSANPRPPSTGARHGASGTIAQINGNILTLTTAQGPVTVNIISDNTTIQNITTGTLSDLHEGQSLSVRGQQDTNGNVIATSIMIRPQVQGTPPTPPTPFTPPSSAQ
jgi:hypothetical protein